MTISAKVICHSKAKDSPDLITMECRYPRFIHAEFMTHRVFSRNASSSRAIPVEKMIQSVINDPAMPVSWGSNKPGMQAGEECTNPVQFKYDEVSAQAAWCRARDNAVNIARGFAQAGYHKQVVNRLLEPFGHITVVVTATEWANFFDLRCHPDADPTMRALAEAMRDAIEGSSASENMYHLPYVRAEDWDDIPSGQDTWRHLSMISAARCARVSYLNHDGTAPDIDKDLKLADMLLTSKHMSPFEHQAQVAQSKPGEGGWFYEHLQGNLTGWNQHRKMLELQG